MWGLVLKNNERFVCTVEKSFRLAQASLDASTADDGFIEVWMAKKSCTYLLCTLKKSTTLQISLNINFKIGEKVSFFSKGNGVVHLTGSLLPKRFGAIQQKQRKAAKNKDDADDCDSKYIILLGGVVAFAEKQAGNGEAKDGLKIKLFYEGHLKDTQKVVDDSKLGYKFVFRDEVKGLYIGVAGLKLREKQTHTIPANLVYGAIGYPPTIPPNSTLVFEVELKNIF